MSKQALHTQIATIEANLQQQLNDVQGRRGVHEDVIKMVVPVQLDQLKILHEIVEAMVVDVTPMASQLPIPGAIQFNG